MLKGKQRKKYSFLAALAGAGITAVPMCAIIFYLLLSVDGRLFQEKEEDRKNTMVWRLDTDLMAGQVIAEKDLLNVQISDELLPAGELKKEMLIGKSLKLNLSKGTLLTKDMIYQGEELTDDKRLHNYSYIKLTDKLKKGDYVDIRIAFPNGADCIVLSKKKIQDLSLYNRDENIPNALWMEVGEEEILRLSSAVVDASLWEGSSIYAILYTSETQKDAIVTYPVNDTVAELIEGDPNIIARAQSVVSKRLRNLLDEGEQQDPVLGNLQEPIFNLEEPSAANEESEGGPEAEDFNEEIVYLD